MGHTAEIAFVEAKDALSIKSLDAFPVRLIDWRAIRLI